MALDAYISLINQMQAKVDLEPVLRHFGAPQRTIEKELGFAALDLRLTAFIAVVFYTLPGLFMVVRGTSLGTNHTTIASATRLRSTPVYYRSNALQAQPAPRVAAARCGTPFVRI